MIFLYNIFFAFWFFLPAGLANMVPVFAAKLFPNWNFPLDFNLTFRGRRILGPNKTWRGLIVGIAVSVITVYLQQEINFFDYSALNPLILGLLLGLGALLGDVVKSFFKRQLDIASGDSLLFFDQLDYIFGGILLSYWYFPLNLETYLYIIGIYFLFHLITSAVGFLLGLKQKPI